VSKATPRGDLFMITARADDSDSRPGGSSSSAKERNKRISASRCSSACAGQPRPNRATGSTGQPPRCSSATAAEEHAGAPATPEKKYGERTAAEIV